MSGKNETVNMQVTIADRSYPLKVLQSDEENMHSAVKLVNDRIDEYRQKFEGKDKQDYLAMCLLNFAVSQMSAENTYAAYDRSIKDRLKRLEHLLAGSSD